MSSPPVADSRPPRHCYKCGREIGPDETICAVCNRAGMATPSATQYHGTVAVAIVAAVALLAIGASLAMRGIGPFDGRATGYALQPDASVVASVAVTNKGSRPGSAKCLLTARDATGRELGIANAVSPRIEAGRTVTFRATIMGVGDALATVSVACQ